MPLASDHLHRIARSVQEKCIKQCLGAFVYCQDDYSITYTTHSLQSSKDPLELVVRTSKLLTKVTRSVPDMSFIDYFSFVTSCFGTWFGVSFLSIKTLTRRMMRRKRRRRVL